MARDPYRYFRIEARELLEGLSDGVLQLEQEDSDSEAVIRKLLRLAHTLKGASRVVKLVPIAEQAHAVEDLLASYRDSEKSAAADAIEAMLERLDSIRAELAALDVPDETRRAQSAASAVEGEYESVRIALSELDDLLRSTLQADIAHRRLCAANQTNGAAADCDPAQLYSGGLAGTTALSDESGSEEAARHAATHSDVLARNLQELHDRIFQLRLLPASIVFADVKRAVRDAAKSTGKEARLEVGGGELRVDAHVLSTVRGALLHLVRNAVVHGIEDSEARKAAGKESRGLISLSVERRGHSVAFICSDDGSGIDVAAIGNAAVRSGLIDSTAASSLDHEAAIELLLSGGLTTSESVTELSGRGVGLNAARESVDRLRGEMLINSSAGSGTSVEMIVPLSLSSMPALGVEVSGSTVLIPLDVIRETVLLGSEEGFLTADGKSALWKDEHIPAAGLARILGLDVSRTDVTRRRAAVVLRSAQTQFAVTVDRIVDIRSIVVHPLPRLSAANDTVAGATFDSMGQPQLVLSASGLIDALVAGGPAAEAPEPVVCEPLPVLVIDDSLTTRMLEQSILRSAGYEVDLAVSAEEALEMASKRKYGLFIVDVEMPGMNGFEFVAHTREAPELRDIPSILVTSRGAPEDRRRGEEVGAKSYFVKSEFDQAALLQNIRRLIG